ncbi:MAG: SPASM domain-containing protein, partial [Clostridia bacterium]|nr:SPASM domain-containing protein [Clostridia bacterium]
LSLDGRREVNDLFRRTPEGRGSYDIIVPKFQKFVKARGDKEYYLRGTYTHNNTDFFNDIKQMLELGFDRLSLEPVVCQPDDPYALTAEDLPVLFANYELLAKKMLERRRAGRPFIFYHYLLDLDHGPCIYKRLAGCGTGVEYLAVTPTGELYPCHQFVGNPQYKMGDLQTGVTNTALRERFKNCNTYAHEECRSCWARLYCSGGCAANAYKATGDIKGIYQYGCELFKKRLECALMLKVAEFEDNESKLGSAE